MESVKVRGITIGEGIPKICVPVVEESEENVIGMARSINKSGADMAEWRVDWFGGVDRVEEVLKTSERLREELGEMPLLFTFRSRREGGEKEISPEAYKELNLAAIRSGYVDMVDAELFTGEEIVAEIMEEAHKAGVKVIVSNHDFDGTPPREEIISRLRNMQEMGADILKIAVMPRKKEDVLTLLGATLEMRETYAEKPLITMSMGRDGIISRAAGEIFGSAVTFGAVGKSSAPGQMEVGRLREIMEILHESIE